MVDRCPLETASPVYLCVDGGEESEFAVPAAIPILSRDHLREVELHALLAAVGAPGERAPRQRSTSEKRTFGLPTNQCSYDSSYGITSGVR